MLWSVFYIWLVAISTTDVRVQKMTLNVLDFLKIWNFLILWKQEKDVKMYQYEWFYCGKQTHHWNNSTLMWNIVPQQ